MEVQQIKENPYFTEDFNEKRDNDMCTASTYKTKDFYIGRTLDYEFSYGEEVTVTPRNCEFDFRHAGKL